MQMDLCQPISIRVMDTVDASSLGRQKGSACILVYCSSAWFLQSLSVACATYSMLCLFQGVTPFDFFLGKNGYILLKSYFYVTGLTELKRERERQREGKKWHPFMKTTKIDLTLEDSGELIQQLVIWSKEMKFMLMAGVKARVPF